MKITVLFASPNKNGSTAILVDNFKRGAEENGHTVEVLDVCKMNVHPCIGCVRCGYEGPCVQRDDNEIIRHTSVLLRYVRTVENSCRPLLRLQFKPEPAAFEIGFAHSGVER